MLLCGHAGLRRRGKRITGRCCPGALRPRVGSAVETGWSHHCPPSARGPGWLRNEIYGTFLWHAGHKSIIVSSFFIPNSLPQARQLRNQCWSSAYPRCIYSAAIQGWGPHDLLRLLPHPSSYDHITHIKHQRCSVSLLRKTADPSAEARRLWTQSEALRDHVCLGWPLHCCTSDGQ